MRKQYIAWALLFCLLPGICISVHAADEALTINLLNAVEFFCHSVSPVPSFNLISEDHVRITWSTIIPYRCDKFVLGIYSSCNILNISFNGIVGNQIGNNGYYYQFEFINGDDVLTGSTACTLEIDLMQEQEQNINLVSFYGYQSNYIEVDQVDYLLMKEYLVRDHELLQFDTIFDSEASLPFSREYYQLSWSGTPERLYYGISYVNIDPADIGVQYLDSLQVQFSFTGTDYHSARLIDKVSGDTVTVLDYNYFHTSGYPFETMLGYSDYAKPPWFVRLFAVRIWRPMYYKYFDSWELKELPPLPPIFKPYSPIPGTDSKSLFCCDRSFFTQAKDWIKDKALISIEILKGLPSFFPALFRNKEISKSEQILQYFSLQLP